jgi:glycosyltransferase involved in cell wall biosynthesis
MRILHIMASRGQGGAETYATDIMLSLHKLGVDQCVVMAVDAPRYTEIVKAGIRTAPEVLGHSPRPFFHRHTRPPPEPPATGEKTKHGLGESIKSILTPYIRYLQRHTLLHVLEKEKPDIVHCWMRRAASLMPQWDRETTIGWFGGYYKPRHFRRCGHIVGVTQDIVNHIIEHNVPRERAHFVPTFPDVKDEPAASRALLSTPDKAFVILALSRLHRKKGLDTLLKAARLMPDAVVWLAGEGPLQKKLRRMAKKLGIASRVRFLGWRTDRGALLRAANVCVLPSRYEPFGTVILEAWAAGTPLVACKSAGPAAHVIDNENGVLVDIDDPNALAEALARIRDDSGLCKRLTTNGQAAYTAAYTREAVTKRMLSLYESILSNQLSFS